VVGQKYVSVEIIPIGFIRGFNFKGDEFNVYRALRSINPSPIYSFLIMDFKIGLHLKHKLLSKTVKPKYIPSQGTFKRTGDDEKTQY
jgi:anthranilate synthase component 1